MLLSLKKKKVTLAYNKAIIKKLGTLRKGNWGTKDHVILGLLIYSEIVLINLVFLVGNIDP